MKQPSADHPITVTPTKGRVQVKFGGRVIADSTRALTLQESSYPPVQYIPREDAQMAFFESTAHKTHCPYKGDASYFSLKAGDKRAENAVWSYVEPYPAVDGHRRASRFLSRPGGFDRGREVATSPRAIAGPDPAIALIQTIGRTVALAHGCVPILRRLAAADGAAD